MLQYEALYRKYRPQNFEEVVGQDESLSLLKKAVAEKKPFHAYLFSGSRGVGKTSLARIFAKSLGSNPEDIYELDAASNRGIDEVRDLRESVHTLPFSSPYKVYILDEAHMLTKEAANALLKTLEEPPKHVIFILATTEREKLPDTIHSRCQSIYFNEPDTETLSRHIAHVAEKELFTVSEEARFLIAKEARGSFRDALGILEKMMSSVDGKNIEETLVKKILGLTSKEMVHIIIKSIFSADNKTMQETLNEAKHKKVSPELLFEEVVEVMRKLLLLRIGVLSPMEKEIKELATLQQEMKIPVQSKHILFLLEKSPLLKLGEDKSWTIVSLLFLEVSTL